MSSEKLLPRPNCSPGRESVWKHMKSGALYRVVTVARHSERPNEWIVVYRALWRDGDDWVRNIIQSPNPNDLQWPGFLDLVDPEAGTERFEYVSGSQTWEEGEDRTSGLGPLARLYNEATAMQETGPVHEGLKGELLRNPNYRRLLRVIAAAVPTLFDEPVEVEAPDVVADLRDNRLKLLREAAKRYDNDMDDAANGGANARPPTGDDYNALMDIINAA